MEYARERGSSYYLRPRHANDNKITVGKQRATHRKNSVARYCLHTDLVVIHVTSRSCRVFQYVLFRRIIS